MDCKTLYLTISGNLQNNVQSTLDSKYMQNIASANAFIDDFRLWEKWISNKYGSEIFKLAISEYETSILFCLQSLYKQAFTALRATLEHTLFGVQLTTNLYQYRQWKNNCKDVYWSEITNPENGIFSFNYFSAFAPDLCSSSPLIAELAKRIYRECSQFTHGNYVIGDSLCEPGLYDERLVAQFFEVLESVKYVIEFSLFVRFNQEITSSEISVLEPQLAEHLGHFKEVADYLW